MKIDKDNYESWMLDYLEGRLSGKQLALFEEFLTEHPELREEADGMDKLQLEPSEQFFADKEKLKARMLKQVIEEEELSCFEAVEGTLQHEKKQRFDKRIDSSARLAEKLKQYQEAKLEAPEGILFPNKAALHRTEPVISVIPIWQYAAGAAAILAGVIYLAIPSKEGAVQVAERQNISQIIGDTTKSKASKEIKEMPAAKKDRPGTPKPPKIVKPWIPPTVSPMLASAAPAKKVTAKKVVPTKQFVAPITPVSSPKQQPVAEDETIYTAQLEPTPKQVVRDWKPSTKSTVVAKADVPAVRIPVGTTNANFVKLEEKESTLDRLESLKDLRGFRNKMLAKVGGKRLQIKETGDKTIIKFESQMLGFSTTLDR